MDSLNTLIEKKQFDLVIKLTENSNDPNDLFYHISALVGLCKVDAALSFFLSKRKILEQKMSLCMKVHMDLLCLLNRYDEAYEEINYYQNLPYISQEIEEQLKELPKYVRDLEKKNYLNHELDEQQIKKMLSSGDAELVIAAIDTIRNQDIKPFIIPLAKLLTDFPKQSIRSFVLLLFVQKNINIEVKFNHIDEILNLNPSKLTPPFTDEHFDSLVKRIYSEFKNPVLSENAVQILSSYIIFIYPDTISIDDDSLLEALYTLTSEYLQNETNSSLEERCLNKGIDLNKIKHLIKSIKIALEEF